MSNTKTAFQRPVPLVIISEQDVANSPGMMAHVENDMAIPGTLPGDPVHVSGIEERLGVGTRVYALPQAIDDGLDVDGRSIRFSSIEIDSWEVTGATTDTPEHGSIIEAVYGMATHTNQEDDKALAELVRLYGNGVLTAVIDRPTFVQHMLQRVDGALQMHRIDLEEMQSRARWLRARTGEYRRIRETGISAETAIHMLEALGERPGRWLEKQPYVLVQKESIRWSSIDTLGRGLGFPDDSKKRYFGALEATISRLIGRGNTAAHEDELNKHLRKALDVERETAASIIREGEEVDLIARAPNLDAGIYSLRGYHQVEATIARDIARRVSRPSTAAQSVKIADWLNPEQHQAVEKSLTYPVSIMVGPAGSGKTATLHAMMDAAKASGKTRIALAAPTGAAAIRMKEAVQSHERDGVMDPKTIHLLLEYNPQFGFRRHANNPIEADMIVVDETSMQDTELAWRLLDAAPEHATIVFIGDDSQIPSVSPGAFLRDGVESCVVPTTRLQSVHRTAEDNRITLNANAVLAGEMVIADQRDGTFNLVESSSDDMIRRQIIDHVKTLLNQGVSVDDIQVATPRNGTRCGVLSMNNALADILRDPSMATDNPIEAYTATGPVQPGDRVMRTGRNDLESGVANGSVGKVSAVSVNDEGKKSVVVDFPGTGEVAFTGKDEFRGLQRCYASTVHKLQGAQAPHVIAAASSSHKGMWDQQMWYTMITRAQENCTIIGSMSMVEDTIRKGAEPRQTGLRGALRAEAEKRGLTFQEIPKDRRLQQKSSKATPTQKASQAPDDSGRGHKERLIESVGF